MTVMPCMLKRLFCEKLQILIGFLCLIILFNDLISYGF